MIGIEIVAPTVEFITPKYQPDWAQASMKLIEECGRVSHKSEDRITADSAEPFIRKIALGYGHESIIEHAGFTSCFIGSRSMSHQLVRHRIAAYTQESQRYCDYGKGPEEEKTLKVIMPPSIVESNCMWGLKVFEQEGELLVGDRHADLGDWLDVNYIGKALSSKLVIRAYNWCRQKIDAYRSYLDLLGDSVKAEDAREDLPNACKTEVYTTYNWRQWRHVLNIRLEKHAQWQIRYLMWLQWSFFRRHVPLLVDGVETIIFTEDLKEWNLVEV